MSSPLNNLKIALIWQRFGPYHLARLRGAAEVFHEHGWSVAPIEVSSFDNYAWEAVDGAQHTLFPQANYESLSSVRVRRAVERRLTQLNPHAVAVNGWSVAEALAATNWCRRHQRPAVLMSESHQGSGKWWKEWLKRRRVRRCSAAIVGGRWHADYLASLGFPRDRIIIGYDAVDNGFFQDGADDARIRQSEIGKKWNLPKRYFYANTRFLQRKNIHGLLRAYARYRAQHEATAKEGSDPKSNLTWELVITGNGVMEAKWKDLSQALGIGQSVCWPGFIQYADLPYYYGLASAFVHPARCEAWGLVVNEAAAAGLPLIVASRVGAACELIEQGENGFAVDPDDVEQMADAMLRIAQASESVRQAMGHRSQELVSRFSPVAFGQALWTSLEIGLERTALARQINTLS